MESDSYCPVHKIKCQEWKDTEESVKGLEKEKLSIKMFRIFLTLAILVIGGLNAITYRNNQETLRIVDSHVQKTNTILHKISHGLSEVALNQRKVMTKTQLEFEHLPDYRVD